MPKEPTLIELRFLVSQLLHAMLVELKIEAPGSHVSNDIVLALNDKLDFIFGLVEDLSELMPSKTTILESKFSSIVWPKRPREDEWKNEKDEAKSDEKYNAYEDTVNANFDRKQKILEEIFRFINNQLVATLIEDDLKTLMFGNLQSILKSLRRLNKFYLEYHED